MSFFQSLPPRSANNAHLSPLETRKRYDAFEFFLSRMREKADAADAEERRAIEKFIFEIEQAIANLQLNYKAASRQRGVSKPRELPRMQAVVLLTALADNESQRPVWREITAMFMALEGDDEE